VAQGDVVEEAEGVGRLTAGAPGQLTLVDQMSEVGLDFVAGDLVGRAVIVLRQADHGGDIRLVVRGAKPRTVMSRIMRSRSSLMEHLLA
jgi:hypothetical protein